MTLSNRHAPSQRAILTLAPVFNFDCEEDRIQLSKDLCIRTMNDNEIRAIREYERVVRKLPPHAVEKLKFAIDLITEEAPEFFDTRSKAIERINFVSAIIRLWQGIAFPPFVRIMVSNVLYSAPVPNQHRDSLFASGAFQITTLASPAPIAAGVTLHQFTKVEAETFAQLFTKADDANYGRMKVAFQRLKTFTEEGWPECIIDAMIGFEALYCSRDDEGKGSPIAQRAAKLIGRSLQETNFIANFLVEAYKLRNRIVHGEDVNPGHWVELTRMIFRNDPYLKPYLSESNSDDDHVRRLPPTAAIETLGQYLCRSIQAKLPKRS